MVHHNSCNYELGCSNANYITQFILSLFKLAYLFLVAI
jgi:hypothetical protein